MQTYQNQIGQKMFTFYETDGHFDRGLSELTHQDKKIATARKLAKLRIEAGPQSPFFTNGVWVAENFNYFPDGRILVASADYNPILKNPKEAADCHRQGREYFLDDAVVRELELHADEDPLVAAKKGVLLLPKSAPKAERTDISVRKLAQYPVTSFLFGNAAKGMQRFLAGEDIGMIPLFVYPQEAAKRVGKPFARALLIYWQSNAFSLLGSSRLSDDHGRMWDISEESTTLEYKVTKQLREQNSLITLK